MIYSLDRKPSITWRTQKDQKQTINLCWKPRLLGLERWKLLGFGRKYVRTLEIEPRTETGQCLVIINSQTVGEADQKR